MDRAGRAIEPHMKEESLNGETVRNIDTIFGVALRSRRRAESADRKPPAQITHNFFRVIKPLAGTGCIGNFQAGHFGLATF